jgi:hypothetical protein
VGALVAEEVVTVASPPTSAQYQVSFGSTRIAVAAESLTAGGFQVTEQSLSRWTSVDGDARPAHRTMLGLLAALDRVRPLYSGEHDAAVLLYAATP